MKTTINTITIFFILFSIVSCSATHNMTTKTNHSAITDRYGNAMLWGEYAPSALQQSPYNTWFSTQYGNYKPDTAVLKSMDMQKMKMDIFLGTWCGDSKREVPRMLKALEATDMPKENIRLLMVSNRDSVYKQTPGNESADAGIFRVPTFVIYGNDGHEAGRIIESPVATLEKDMVAIVQGNAYTPGYDKMNRLMQFCLSAKYPVFKKKITEAVSKVKDSSFGSHVLNNMAMVLMGCGKLKKAGRLLNINEALFPADLGVLITKAKYFRKCGKKVETAAFCRKILLREPENASAKEILLSVSN
jgi:hypothetical protein